MEVPGLGPGRDWFGVVVELLGLMLLALEVLGSDLTAVITELDDVEALVPDPEAAGVEVEETGSFLISVAESAARIASATMSFFF